VIGKSWLQSSKETFTILVALLRFKKYCNVFGTLVPNSLNEHSLIKWRYKIIWRKEILDIVLRLQDLNSSLQFNPETPSLIELIEQIYSWYLLDIKVLDNLDPSPASEQIATQILKNSYIKVIYLTPIG
jgi:hypothetical protein